MKKIWTLVIFLAAVSGLSGLILSVVNDMTAPIIEEQKMAAVKESLQVLYSGYDFSEETVSDAGASIQNLYVATKGGNTEGYIYKGEVNGYGGKVSYLVAINKDGSYQGFKALSYDAETSGLGSRIGTDEFSDQFTSKSVDDNIDTLSGATITSSAVKKGIGEVVEHFNKNYK